MAGLLLAGAGPASAATRAFDVWTSKDLTQGRAHTYGSVNFEEFVSGHGERPAQRRLSRRTATAPTCARRSSWTTGTRVKLSAKDTTTCANADGVDVWLSPGGPVAGARITAVRLYLYEYDAERNSTADDRREDGSRRRDQENEDAALARAPDRPRPAPRRGARRGRRRQPTAPSISAPPSGPTTAPPTRGAWRASRSGKRVVLDRAGQRRVPRGRLRRLPRRHREPRGRHRAPSTRAKDAGGCKDKDGNRLLVRRRGRAQDPEPHAAAEGVRRAHKATAAGTDTRSPSRSATR